MNNSQSSKIKNTLLTILALFLLSYVIGSRFFRINILRNLTKETEIIHLLLYFCMSIFFLFLFSFTLYKIFFISHQNKYIISKFMLLLNSIKSLYMKEKINMMHDFSYMRQQLERDLLYIIDNILFIKRRVYSKYDINIMKYLYEIVLLFHLGLLTSILTNPSDLSITNHVILIMLDPMDPLNSDYYDIPLSRITLWVMFQLYLKYKACKTFY